MRKKNIIVVGLQWGDEGKGKIVDLLSKNVDIIARYQGGNNAGHTVVTGNISLVFRLVPSGILNEDKICILGNGVVVDPVVLFEELEALQKINIRIRERFYISHKCHIIMPYHKRLDIARERLRGAGMIGTTGRGIGPAYEDKVARIGIRAIDLTKKDVLYDKIIMSLKEKNYLFENVLGENIFNPDELINEYFEYGNKLKDYLIDSSEFINQSIEAGKNIMLEGAQGTFLDVDHGTYPYVTSSNTVAGGSMSGIGIGPTKIDEVIGITKAYTTRVGEGYFPTELNEGLGDAIRDKGEEFGSVTGRPRRCGWFDANLIKTAKYLNGITGMVVTKLDVLSGLKKINICTGYLFKGSIINHLPYSSDDFKDITPVYEESEGWDGEISAVKTFKDLPVNAQKYLMKLEQITEIPINIISLGKDRMQTITLKEIF
ncbi:MAG: adenylosuccinate synthase [Candidatus Acididesulfobacter diazotrophicus]|jgi:adenylosuccinate synthase|uniref:Adenylosuccinate synthetase n=1 Tax=Candidatus Acididesulfobacter diazotrophicus TaxID=2597226 RepID=A0A519BQG6_9DELT|nr:MAG: adenylosuccinate synthase [Candidatus Acididesulfobacter diazotrophicus]